MPPLRPSPCVVERDCAPAAIAALGAAGLDPVLARIYAARGLTAASELDLGLAHLLPPGSMRNLEQLACILADAIAGARRLLIVGDYDCDGASACAVGVLALRAFGARVDYLVPNRFEFGYGLTPEIVRLAADRQPDFLITVDNGISSVEGVAEANRRGMRVLVTDHHLPGAVLPDAACIVNPNQQGCAFASKSLAGVGVMFYAMLQLRSELRRRGTFAGGKELNLAELLDLVALGTVADVVRLDRNNRVLVEQGLRRIRAGRCRPGIGALLRGGGRIPERASAYDLGFVLGPRINAAGRLTDMSLGIECLLADDPGRAAHLAQQLDALNRERRSIEADMQVSALALLDATPDPGSAAGLALYDSGWHQGVIGILAARLRERYHRPVIAFADGPPGELKGSGRSIPALHLRDALDLLDKRYPGLLLRFGGHAGAAGVSIRASDLERFRAAFDATLAGLLTPADLQQRIETDGALDAREATLELAQAIEAVAWGQGFPAPRFHGTFEVGDQRVLSGGHLKLRLRFPGAPRSSTCEAMLFGHADLVPDRIQAVYRLETNEWNGLRSPQLVIEHWQSALQPVMAASLDAPANGPLLG
jgi:single-stranded-DNA-specific exonuclease